MSEFREAGHRVADLVADYLERLETYPVVPRIRPGEIRSALPAGPPERAEPLDAILADYTRLIEPNITHWQHPGFMAYFPSVATGPGILGEWLAAGLNSNVMLWRNAPASTELEEVVVVWLRSMLGLPDAFDGMFTDTASISSLLALVAARHEVPGLEARDQGLAGRALPGRLRVYASTEAHSSIDKAAIVSGVGHAGLRKIAADAEYRMRPDVLAAAIAEDRAGGWLPFAVVATLGTTSSTSIDPVAQIAAICERERLWLHVDAAYGGAVALVPEQRALLAGWERADSIVFNLHKWMFTPFDASLLLFRRPETFRSAFSLVPDYLRTPEADAHNYNEYGIQLGRRFRALKVWMLVRALGTAGIAATIREHLAMAREFAGWVEADPDWERMAPVPLSTVCFRHHPRDFAGSEAELDRRNEALLERVNADGRIYLSATRLGGRFILRVALGNPRATRRHLETCWELLRAAARAATSDRAGPR